MKRNFRNRIGIQFGYNRYSILSSLQVRLNVSVVGNIQPNLFFITMVLTVFLIQKKIWDLLKPSTQLQIIRLS